MTEDPQTPRKDLDNEQFIRLRKHTEKIGAYLHKRVKGHLGVLKPLFNPVKMLGAYIKSANMEDVPGSDKAFAKLQEKYAAVCEKPFGLPKKLQTPLGPIINQIDAAPYRYPLYIDGDREKPTSVIAPTRWVLSYQSDCPYDRLREMVSGAVTRQPEEMKQSLIKHLTMVLLLEQFKEITRLLTDLRYEVEVAKTDDLGGLPVAILKAPIESFLPSDDFIRNVTQLSGVPAFQEIVDFEAVENMPDPLKSDLQAFAD